MRMRETEKQRFSFGSSVHMSHAVSMTPSHTLPDMSHKRQDDCTPSLTRSLCVSLCFSGQLGSCAVAKPPSPSLLPLPLLLQQLSSRSSRWLRDRRREACSLPLQRRFIVSLLLLDARSGVSTSSCRDGVDRQTGKVTSPLLSPTWQPLLHLLTCNRCIRSTDSP